MVYIALLGCYLTFTGDLVSFWMTEHVQKCWVMTDPDPDCGQDYVPRKSHFLPKKKFRAPSAPKLIGFGEISPPPIRTYTFCRPPKNFRGAIGVGSD